MELNSHGQICWFSRIHSYLHDATNPLSATDSGISTMVGPVGLEPTNHGSKERSSARTAGGGQHTFPKFYQEPSITVGGIWAAYRQ